MAANIAKWIPFDRHVDERQDRPHDERVGHHRIEQEHRAPFVLADLADDHGDEGASDRGGQRCGMAEVQFGRAGPQDDEHADQPHNHRAPAVQAHSFAEDRDRQDGDEHRRRKQDRVDLGQGQGREGIERRCGDHDRTGRPDRRPPGMDRDQRPGRPVAHQRERDQREGQERREEDNLERREGLAEQLDEDVMRRVEREGQNREACALQVASIDRHGEESEGLPDPLPHSRAHRKRSPRL
jgi:hypothetical protein